MRKKRRLASETREKKAERKSSVLPDETMQAIRDREAAIDAAIDMTFPASDPPSWTP